MYISILYISFTGRSVYQSYPEQCYNIVLLYVPTVFICIGARVFISYKVRWGNFVSGVSS